MSRRFTPAARTARLAVPDLLRAVLPLPFPVRTSALISSLALALVGCDWVDSTGRQSGDGVRETVRLDDIPPGGAVPLDEDSVTPLEASGVGVGDAFDWSDDSLEEGSLDSCGSLEDFRTDIAASSFDEACTDPDDCSFTLERAPEGDEGDGEPPDPEGAETDATVVFSVRVPSLKAPVGVRRTLTVTTSAGERITNAYDFCLISINVAPDANDDGPYVVRAGETLTVSGDGAQSLLANDTDDEDAANQPLSIDPVSPRPPTSSSAFSLGSDGGFVYTARADGILNFVNDSFDYVVSDGSSTSEASVSVRIEAGNGAPVAHGRPPLPATLEATVGEPFEIDLAGFFDDPDGDPLIFLASGDGLPPSGTLTLSASGVLAGTPIGGDVGDYALTVVVSDGERETSELVELTVSPAPNAAPEYTEGTVTDVLALAGRSIAPQTPLFVDPDGDPLAFELDGIAPEGIVVDADTGTLRGRPLERGLFRDLSIVATDPAGESARSETFSIRVF